jgi:hypothetical protein
MASPTPTAPTWEASGTIDQQFTTPALEYRSTGAYLVWSSGARADKQADVAPDLFGSTPDGDVQLLYDNPSRDSRLEVIGGDGSQFAFVEINARAFGLGGWKLWYLSGPGSSPEVIDEGPGDQLPFFGMSGDRLVWTAVHGHPKESQLLLVELTTMTRRVLLSSAPEQVQYWFPAIDGDRVVYGTVELSPDGSSDERHVYLLDLGSSGPGQRLDEDRSASEPAIRGDVIVWKESSPSENFLVGGRLVQYSIASKVSKPIALGSGHDRFIEPTIGNDYVTAWSDNDRALYLADLITDQNVSVLDLGLTEDDPHDNVGRPDLSGDLLAYMFGPAGGDLELRWIRLR